MNDLISKFNAHGALKIPVSLWLVLGYGLRHIAFILFPPTRIAFETYTEVFIGKFFLLPDAIITLIIFINTARLPEASRTIRQLWHWSYWILVGAFVLDTLLTLVTQTKAATNPEHLHFSIVIVTLMIDLGIIAYLLTSKTVKDVFKSFPESDAAEPQIAITEEINAAQPLPLPRTTSNIPNATLISEAIVPGYQFSGYPFNQGENFEPLIQIRQHLTNNNLILAEKGLRYLLEKQPQNPEYWHELALVAFAANKLPQAEALILKAMIFDAHNYLYWRNLGEIRRRLGHLSNAIEDAQRALVLKPDDVNSYYNLGLALWDAGRNEDAMKAFENAKQQHPELQ